MSLLSTDPYSMSTFENPNVNPYPMQILILVQATLSQDGQKWLQQSENHLVVPNDSIYIVGSL